jgi:hypothetical protein
MGCETLDVRRPTQDALNPYTISFKKASRISRWTSC